MNPRPTDEELAAYYADSFWQQLDVEDSIRNQKARALSIKQYIELKTPALLLRDALAVLEVGSGFGETINLLGKAIRNNGGRAELFSLEPSAYARDQNAACYEEVTLLGTDVEELDAIQASFDLIILSHVLEHFPNPLKVLRLIVSKMAPDGLLYVQVPNFYGHWCADYGHNYCFTETSLGNVLRLAKLIPISMDLSGRSRDWPMYLTCVAYKDSSDAGLCPIRAEKLEGIWQRRIGSQIGLRFVLIIENTISGLKELKDRVSQMAFLRDST